MQNNEGPKANQLKSPGCLPISLKRLATNDQSTPASLISSDEDALHYSCTFLHSLNHGVVGGGLQRRGSRRGGRWRKAHEEGGIQIIQHRDRTFKEMGRNAKNKGKYVKG